MSGEDMLADMEAAAQAVGGVLAWTKASGDPMVEEVVQAVVMTVEQLDVAGPDDEPMVALVVGDGAGTQTFVMRREAWQRLSEKGK